ncbi:alpha/beta fold hydrolase [Virgibacillus dakarensis]|nr:alpha/beta fold hydrolase [Virgibacillus dakarensis]
MNYVVFGKGEKPLIIIPGLGDGVQNVEKSSNALAYFYRKYAKMYRVFVCSRKNQLSKGYTTRDMAKDIKLFMDAQNITYAYVMGVSMGGMIVQHLAADYPDYVEKLIVAVSSSKPNQKSNQVISDWIRMVKEGRYGDFTIDTMEKTYTDRYLWKYRLFYFLLRKTGKPQSTQNFFAQAEACLIHNAYERLPMIKCPTLVVGGEKDQVLGSEASRIIAGQITGSQLIMYPNLGHGAFQESKQFEKDSIAFLMGDRQ